MRQLESYLIGDMHDLLSNDMTVEEAYAITFQIEKTTIKKFNDINKMNVIIEPFKKPK